jgi:hypothetical protein
VTISHVIKELNHIVTSAAKDGSMNPTCPFEDLIFLKRKFVYDEDLKGWLAPLLEQSIYRSLCYIEPSKKVPIETQMAGILRSANDEWFFHGRRKFEANHAELQLCWQNLNLGLFGNLADWNSLFERWEGSGIETTLT